MFPDCSVALGPAIECRVFAAVADHHPQNNSWPNFSGFSPALIINQWSNSFYLFNDWSQAACSAQGDEHRQDRGGRRQPCHRNPWQCTQPELHGVLDLIHASYCDCFGRQGESTYSLAHCCRRGGATQHTPAHPAPTLWHAAACGSWQLVRQYVLQPALLLGAHLEPCCLPPTTHTRREPTPTAAQHQQHLGCPAAWLGVAVASLLVTRHLVGTAATVGAPRPPAAGGHWTTA